MPSFLKSASNCAGVRISVKFFASSLEMFLSQNGPFIKFQSKDLANPTASSAYNNSKRGPEL